MNRESIDKWQKEIQKELDELKIKDTQRDEIINQLIRKTDFHERDIKEIKSTLSEIKEDTKWLRRSITNAIIIALIGGFVAIFYAAIGTGV